jgi:Glycosyl transferase family 2
VSEGDTAGLEPTRNMSTPTRMLRLELSQPIPSIDLAHSDEVWALATDRGVPVAQIHIPGPGRCAQPECLLAAIIGRQAAPQVAFDRVRQRLEQRISSAPAPVRLTVSVVVCTHRRPGPLAMLLRALQELAPTPAEIIVVDNAPGEDDNRELVERYGARYLREDAQGLDIARATGVRAARGDVIAFTDDDAIPAPSWLRSVSRLFADPMVGCVTGPVLPYELNTPAQRRYERSASLNRGLVSRVEDWTTLPAGLGATLGVGANMLFRRTALQLPEVMFLAELDAGTATESGGDGYALYRMIADGWRAVYDPATYVFHDYRPDAPSFHRAIRGYGIGLGSLTATVLIRDRDLGALPLGISPILTYVGTAFQRLAGRSDAVDTHSAWDQVRGLALSPVRVRRARRTTRGRGDGLRPSRAATREPATAVMPASRTLDSRSTSVSVVMLEASAAGRRAAMAFRLAAYDGVKELIVPGQAFESPEAGLSAAAGKATGDVVLFWSADHDPAGDVVAAHAAAHAGEAPGIAVGDLGVRCGDSRLASRLRARDLSDRAHRARAGASLTFLDVGDANVSFSAELLQRIGGLDPAFGAGCLREAALRGVAVGGALRRSAALATMTCTSTFSDLMAIQGDAGEAAARLSAVHGEKAPILQRIVSDAGPYAWVDRLVTAPPAVKACAGLLAVLEHGRMRRRWARTAGRALGASFRRGAASTTQVTSRGIRSTSAIDVDSNAPLVLSPLGAKPTTLRVGGKPAGFTPVLRNAWTPDVAAEIAHGIQPQAWTGMINDVTRAQAPDVAALPTLTVLLSSTTDARLTELTGPGLTVQVLPPCTPASCFWRIVDEAIRACDTELVALPLPRRDISREWADEVRLALSGSALGMAGGIGLAECWAAQPIKLVSECRGARTDLTLTHTDYIAVRPTAYVAIGGFSTIHGTVGDQVLPCDLLRRFLGAGGTVAWTTAPGIRSHPGPGRDGAPAAVRGAVLAAAVSRRDAHAKGLLLVTALELVAEIFVQRSVPGALSALRELARFSRSAVTVLTAGC